MRAVRFHTFGDPTVLRVEDAPEPHAGPGQVRIRVQAASVNPVDAKLRSGVLQGRMPCDLPAIPGMDAAGVVDEVGEGVDDVETGDAVFGLATTAGATAEYAVLKAWARRPPRWSVAEAAAAGLVAQTAMLALEALGDLDGKTILIEGAAGGVGSTAVELSLAQGATVIGTASEPKHDVVRDLGAIATTYGDGLSARVRELAPDGVDLAFDCVGSGSLSQLIDLAGDPSRVVTIVDRTGPDVGVSFVGGDADAHAHLAFVAELGEQGAYAPRVSRIYTFDDVRDAHVQIETGRTTGKLVVAVGDEAGTGT